MEETKFEIGGKTYDVVKRGVAQANQVAQLGQWLSVYGVPTFRKLDGDFTSLNGGLELLTFVLGTLSGEALVDLFTLTFGCSQEVTEEHFDIALLLDGLVALYNNQPTIQKLVARFFSATQSTPSKDESSTQ